MPVSLSHFASRAGDHNDRAMQATPTLAAVLSERLAVSPTVIGRPQPASPTNWDRELAAALPALQQMSTHYDQILSAGKSPVTALSRCAVALATLPMVAKHRPDAVVLWFDAHADLNTPDTTETGYLGGLALSGPLGLWNSGLGAGLTGRRTILVGTRDIDYPEHGLISTSEIALVAVAPEMAHALAQQVAGRPIYLHIDCDVLQPGTVPTDYTVPQGMTLMQLEECAAALTGSEVIGIEIGELETDGRGHHDTERSARLMVSAIEPLLQHLSP